MYDVQRLHVSTGHLYVFIREISIKVLCPFPHLVGCFFIVELPSSLYTLQVKPMSVMLSADIFSHSIGCLFHFYDYLCCAKACKLD